MNKKRELYFFKDYFEEFYETQIEKVQRKIIWTLRIIEEIDRIPALYLKHLKNTSGLYEIRVQVGNNSRQRYACRLNEQGLNRFRLLPASRERL